MSDITNDFIYGFYLSQSCWILLYRLRQHLSNMGPIQTLITVPLLGRLRF